VRYKLGEIELKMKALGFTQRQIENIMGKYLRGKQWEEMDNIEKEQVLQSIDEGITFVRKFLQVTGCQSCCLANIRVVRRGFWNRQR